MARKFHVQMYCRSIIESPCFKIFTFLIVMLNQLKMLIDNFNTMAVNTLTVTIGQRKAVYLRP